MVSLSWYPCIKENAPQLTSVVLLFGIFIPLPSNSDQKKRKPLIFYQHSCYQLFITIGILLANLINFGTEGIQNTGSWRIVLGIGFLWAIILGLGILCFPESPRFDYRHGKHEQARKSIAVFHGVDINHRIVNDTMKDLAEKLREEDVGAEDRKWSEVFTGPRMRYRILLGMAIQMFQQLTGMNYFMVCPALLIPRLFSK